MNNLKKLQQSIGKIPKLHQESSVSLPITESEDSLDFLEENRPSQLHLADFSDAESALAKSYQVKLSKGSSF